MRTKQFLIDKDSDKIISLWFFRHFKVRLKRDNHVFNPDVIIETSDGPVDIDTSFLYSGALEGTF